MGFKKVHANLVELFPQVDWRILKAIAIEYPKDVNAAAEFVVSEVLPQLPQQSKAPDCGSGGRAEHKEQAESSGGVEVGLEKVAASSFSLPNGNTCVNDITVVANRSDPSYPEKELNPTTVLCDQTTAKDSGFHGNAETEELILLVRPQHEEDIVHSSASSLEENINASQVSCETEVAALLGKIEECNVIGHEQQSQFTPTSLMLENGNISQEHIGNFEDDGPSSRESPYPESSFDLDLKDSVVEEKVQDAEDNVQLMTSTTPFDSSGVVKSNEDIRTDLLEDIVEAAKNNKKTLFLAMESVMNLMSHVESQEKLAERAKEEAASAGLDILEKAEELKQMLRRAKEKNDMDAGEIHGEKAILATEMRELQIRLLGLSDERDNAIAILDKMRETLDARLAAAEELTKAAEKEKLEKEESARNAFAEQEAVMEMVVQESKMLQKEAEENSKLREFLMDRGRIVDTLQGEISVICQDVKLLKEKFDDNVPLSKSISSSQTSCILASSGSSSSLRSTGCILGSSIKSVASEPLHVPKDASTHNSPKEGSPTSSIHSQSPKSSREEDKRSNSKEQLDEGWDFFEDEEM